MTAPTSFDPPSNPEQPLVSVISPFFNRRDYVRPLLDMLEEQTLRDFEAIIVDDGSTDNLAEAVAAVQTSFPVRCIRLPTNVGAGAARNIGLDEAKGRYIALLDSDDAWHPDKLVLHVEQFELAVDKDRLVGLSRQIIISHRTFLSKSPLMERSDRVGDYLFRHGGIIQSSTMFLTSELARSARFVENEPGHDDWTFALRLEALGARFEMIADALVFYHDNDRIDRRSPRKAQITLDWLDRYRSLLGDQPYFAARSAFGSRMPRQLNSLGMIVTGFTRCAVSPSRSAYYLATWSFPWMRKLCIHTKQLWWSGRSDITIKRHPHGELGPDQ